MPAVSAVSSPAAAVQTQRSAARAPLRPSPSLLSKTNPSRRPKTPEVRINLETNARVKNRYGPDVFARILRMRLRGTPTSDIAREIGCSRDLVEDQVRLWEAQIDIAVAEMPRS